VKHPITVLGLAVLLAVGGMLPALAQTSGSMMDSPMSKLHDQMGAMKPTGDPDKDYLKNLKMLNDTIHSLMMAEMARGKNAEVMAATKKAMAAQPFKVFDGLDQKFLSE